MPKVEGISVSQSVFGRMLGYGTVTVTGTGGTPDHFVGIRRPMELRRAVHDQTDETTTTATSTTEA